MKFILLIGIFFSAKAFGFQVKQIEGIEGHIESIDFDSDFNCYVVAYLNDVYYLHKIDPEKNVSLTQSFNQIEEVIINSRNDVYVFERTEVKRSEHIATSVQLNSESGDDYPSFGFHDHRHFGHMGMRHMGDPWHELEPEIEITPPTTTSTTKATTQSQSTRNIIWIMKSESHRLQKLYFWEGDEKSKTFLDQEDYLFVSTKHGLVLFKPDQNLPLALELVNRPFESVTSFACDTEGNVYISMISSVCTISKDVKRHLVPSISEPLSDYKLNHFTVSSDSDGNVYSVAKAEGESGKANLIKLQSHRGSKLLYSQFDTTFNFIHATKDRLYFTSYFSTELFYIIFIQRNINGEEGLNQIHEDVQVAAIEDLFEYPLITSDKNLCASDSSGNAFFVHDKTILSIKHNETQGTRISAPSMKKISSILVDKNDNLWVLAENLYFYKKGTTNAIWVANLPGKEDSSMKENKKTGEVYVGSGTGLSAFVNDKP